MFSTLSVLVDSSVNRNKLVIIWLATLRAMLFSIYGWLMCSFKNTPFWADETSLCSSGTHLQVSGSIISEDLVQIQSWSNSTNYYRISERHYMVLTRSKWKKQSASNQYWRQTVDERRITKFLEVVIYNWLNWNTQIMPIAGKISPGIGMIKISDITWMRMVRWHLFTLILRITTIFWVPTLK